MPTTARKVDILDTSVFVHDPSSPLHFKENIVVVPFPVLSELDGLKESRRDAAPYARRAIRILDELRKKGDLHRGVATPGGGVLIVDDEPYSPNDHLVKPDTTDNAIVCTGLKWQRRIEQLRRGNREHQKGAMGKRDIVSRISAHFPLGIVTIISKDINLRVKSSSCNLLTEDYKFDKLVDSESDIYTGMITIPVNPDSFEDFSRLLSNSKDQGITQEDFDGSISLPPKLYANQCCTFLDERSGRSVLAIYKHDGKTPLRFVHVAKPQLQRISRYIQPRNIGQAFALALLRDPTISIVTLSGIAGSGKTLMAIAAGLEKAAGKSGNIYNKLLIYRPTTEVGERLGFLPGTPGEKFEPWQRPILDALNLIANGGEPGKEDESSKKNNYDVKALIKNGTVGIEPINFIQGRSLHGMFVILDETQNLRQQDVKAVATRIGQGAKLILTGDPKQVANDYLDAASNGLVHVIERMRGEPLFGHITLEKSEHSELAELAAKLL